MKPVSFSDLSNLTLTMHVAESSHFETPPFLHLKYSGVYGSGANGSGDAKFIVATAQAAHVAWYCEGVIVDFTELDYRGGDEMSWVYGIGWDAVTRCQHPLSIIVGEKCSAALSTLAKDRYLETCVESLDSATDMIVLKAKRHEECLQKWRDET